MTKDPPPAERRMESIRFAFLYELNRLHIFIFAVAGGSELRIMWSCV